MGGGTVWRGVARLVTPAARVASTSSGATCSFCKVGNPARALKAQSTSARPCGCPPEASSRAEIATQQGSVALWDADEWEFAEEEERVDHVVFGSVPSRAEVEEASSVFGTVPSRAEVEEASSELQRALRLGLLAPPDEQSLSPWAVAPELIIESGASAASRPGSSAACRQPSEKGDNDEDVSVTKPLVASQMALDWLEPPPIHSGQGIIQRAGRDNVAEAFHQFQHNPDVQNMVVSLANDPAVWDAVLANEKIQEFKRKLQGDKGLLSKGDKSLMEDENYVLGTSIDGQKVLESEQSFFSRLQSFWHARLSQFMDVIGNIINGFFWAADKKIFAEEDGDKLDRTVKSCTMLALVVVCVVILKRLAGQAA